MQSLPSKFKNISSYNPRSFIFINQVITKKELEELLLWMFRNYGIRKTCMLAELLKEAGFNYATQGGISISLEDLKVPRTKTPLVGSTNKELANGETKYQRGELTNSEWFQKQVVAWNLTSELLKNEIVDFFERTDPLNPLYMMTFSGARGNLSQVRQLIGMRGLMSDQKGEMIGSAIQKNFREGLTVIDFLISSYGARKGLVDTAIRTADSGYMTRRLIDIAQDVVVRQFDCQSKQGILIIYSRPYNNQTTSSFNERLIGRILAKPILNPTTKKLVANRGQEIDFHLSNKINDLKIPIVSVRSPLTCQSYRSVCQTCFGWDLTQYRLIEIGEAIGIIAAQSIGEPGTQLTMRTFHTGGVFSRELSQQIRSNYSGQVEFSDKLKTQFIRTTQGDYGQVIYNTSFFEIRTYKNEVIRIRVERDDLLMIKNYEFIRKGQSIVQSASTLEDSDTEIQKTLSTKFPGEIYYQLRQNYNFFEYNMLVWVLAGKLITLPFESKQVVRSYKPDNQVFAKTKLVIKANPFTETICVFKNTNIALISKFCDLEDLNILSYKNFSFRKPRQFILKFRNQAELLLQKTLTPNRLSNKNGYIGRYLTKAYTVKTGGNLYSINLNKNSSLKVKISLINEISKGGLYLWLPEEIYKQLSSSLSFSSKEGNFIKKDYWLTQNIFSPINGLISYRKQNRKTNDLSVQSGTILTFDNEKINIKQFKLKFDSQLFFPGEVVFGRIKINRIVYSQIIHTLQSIKVIFRPLTIYSIPQSYTYNPIGHNTNVVDDELIVKINRSFTFKINESINANKTFSKNLIETGLFVTSTDNKEKQKINIFINFRKTQNKKWCLEFGRFQDLNRPKVSPRRLKLQQIKTISFVRANQILEPYTLIGCSEVRGNVTGSPINLRSQYSSRYQSQELMIVDNDHVRELYFDETTLKTGKKDFVFAGDHIGNGLILTIGGKVLSSSGSKFQFRIGKPYLFTEGAKVYKNHKDFAPENTVLGFVTYRIFKTQDIIQGLPKVEEILEARSSSDRALIAEKAGVVTKIMTHARSRSSQIEVLSNIKQLRTIREIPYLVEEIDYENLEVEPYQYINLTQRFHKGLVDPQQLLDISFDYFRQRDSHHKATLRSLYRLASMFIKSIQGVYESQGIKIVDRHLEVIVRQMIIKAKIEFPGNTPLVSGEYLDIQQLLILNKMLEHKQKHLVYYKPAILGLTKAALTTESFISAASFQETVRILTQAAIEGKVDWLRGLKEKVIVGGLIPSGTGILTFLDEWIAKHIFLYGRSVVSLTTRRKFLRKKLQKQNIPFNILDENNSNFRSKMKDFKEKNNINY
uniref:DNA-directed RNA polymerase n=1 Tax=Nannochloropsis gaditana TaxID=72520 RepID=T1RGX9_9STRA|nr:rRNA polymerase beta'' subunit [Nannochloropsis gaditana]